MEIRRQLHVTATLSPEKKTSGTHQIRGWMSSGTYLDALVHIKIYFPDRNLSTIHPPFRQYSLVITPTYVSRLDRHDIIFATVSVVKQAIYKIVYTISVTLSNFY